MPLVSLLGGMASRFFLPGLNTIGKSVRVVKDHLRRQTVQAFEVDRALYKAITRDQSLPYSVRQQVQRLFETELPRDASPTRVRNRCMLTGRGRGVYSEFRLSRIMFKRMARSGMLPGVSKAAW